MVEVTCCRPVSWYLGLDGVGLLFFLKCLSDSTATTWLSVFLNGHSLCSSPPNSSSLQPFWELDRHLLTCFFSIFVSVKFFLSFNPFLNVMTWLFHLEKMRKVSIRKKIWLAAEKYGSCWMNMLHILELELLSLGTTAKPFHWSMTLPGTVRKVAQS